jgi:hypothetical protein
MIGNKSIPIERGKKGDLITIGHRIANREPIEESIERLKSQGVLRPVMALEMDATSKTSYDYLTKETEPCPKAHAGGGLMELVVDKGGIRLADLLRQVYDICDRFPLAPCIWYYQEGTTPLKGEYSIAEARVVLDSEKAYNMLGGHGLAGTYYLSYDKLLQAICELTTPRSGCGSFSEPSGELKGMLDVDAYYISQQMQRAAVRDDEKVNWQIAQQKMAARLIWHMKSSHWATTWLEISGPLEVPPAYSGTSTLGQLNNIDREIAFRRILRKLKGDDSIHLIKAGMPAWLYVSHMLTWGMD